MGSRKISFAWLVGASIFVWGIWISGVFGNRGLLQARRLTKVRDEMTLRVKTLESEKVKLETLLSSLDKNSFTQEKTIRESLGFVREDEIVFEFP